MSENKVLKIEKASLTENGIFCLGGYSYIKEKDSLKTEIKLRLVNHNTKECIYIESKGSLRTDITFLHGNKKNNYDNSGFNIEDFDLNLLSDGEWKLYISLITEEEIVDLPILFHLAEIKNQIKPLLIKRRMITPTFSETLQFKIEKVNIISYFNLKMYKAKFYCRFFLSLVKERDLKTLWISFLLFIFDDQIYKKKIWLIGERKDTAQDNSLHLFRKLNENQYGVKSAYVIDKNSKDYNKVKQIGKVVKFDSVVHTLLLFKSNYLINSYLHRANMFTHSYNKIMKWYPEWKISRNIFLQHGVIGFSRVNHSLHKNRTSFNKFVVSSPLEKKHLIEEYGYEEKDLILSGLPRWDALKGVTKSDKNTILIMPTWRSWIKSEEELIESMYWKKYIEFLGNENLHSYLEENNAYINFFPHYQMQKLIKNLKLEFHPRIKLIKQDENDVQSLLISHDVLITDYSTVSFDFAYMNKPVIFYQFDYEDFYSKHYNIGYINHAADLFGIRVTEQEALLNTLRDDDLMKFSRSVNSYICKLDSHTDYFIRALKDMN